MTRTLTSTQIAGLVGEAYQQFHSMSAAFPVKPVSVGPGRVRNYGEREAAAIVIGCLLVRSGMSARCEGVARAIRWALNVDLQAEIDKGVNHLIVNAGQCFAARADAMIFGKDSDRPAVAAIVDLPLVHQRLTAARLAVAEQRQLTTAATN
jgi:hypothetical protein